MESRIREFVADLFQNAPKNRKSIELMEELVQNLTEKFNDLISEGKTPEAAYNIIASSIGDVGELFEELEVPEMRDERDTKARQKSAVLTSIAVMAYILSVVPVMLIGEFAPRYTIIGALFMFIMIAGATGLLIYNNMTKPRYMKADDTMVEEFREFRQNRQSRKEVIKAVSGAMWSIIVVIYFLISFWTMAWHITWVIFLIGAAIQNIVQLIMNNYD